MSGTDSASREVWCDCLAVVLDQGKNDVSMCSLSGASGGLADVRARRGEADGA